MKCVVETNNKLGVVLFL